MSLDDLKDNDLNSTIAKIGDALAALDPGPLAELRRLNPSNSTAPIFWRFVSRFGLQNETKWAQIIQLTAILTEKGRSRGKKSPHDRNYPFGKALCDGTLEDWGKGEKPHPMLSEQRFARLLTAKGEMRADLITTTVRMLARRKTCGVNCIDLAAFILNEDSKHGRRLARDYYARLDRAEQTYKPSGEDK